MDPSGPNLRRLYLPGLDPLKLELARFELLLTRHAPELAAHLAAAGLPPVLYASQWLLTAYACPFPTHFCARLLDIMLQVSGAWHGLGPQLMRGSMRCTA